MVTGMGVCHRIVFTFKSEDDKMMTNVTKQFGLNETGDIIYQLNSQCQVCSHGFILHEGVSSCCGMCDPCLGQNYTNSTSSTNV